MSDAATYHRGQRNFGTGYDMIDQIEALEAKLAKAVEALDRIASITVHSGGEIHGVTAQHWRTAFEVAQDEATITLAAVSETHKIKGESHD